VKSRLARQAQPVPPIFEPEVAADAIVWASEHDRREIYVGGSTVAAIVGNKLLPGVGDWYLARTGFDSQQTSEPEIPGRPNNLFAPVDEHRDFGPHGRFTAEARPHSFQTWLTERRRLVAAAAVAGVAIASIVRRL
jgi:hypothetical protein